MLNTPDTPLPDSLTPKQKANLRRKEAMRRNWMELVLKRHNLEVKAGEDPHCVKIFEEGKQNVNGACQV